MNSVLKIINYIEFPLLGVILGFLLTLCWDFYKTNKKNELLDKALIEELLTNYKLIDMVKGNNDLIYKTPISFEVFKMISADKDFIYFLNKIDEEFIAELWKYISWLRMYKNNKNIKTDIFGMNLKEKDIIEMAKKLKDKIKVKSLKIHYTCKNFKYCGLWKEK